MSWKLGHIHGLLVQVLHVLLNHRSWVRLNFSPFSVNLVWLVHLIRRFLFVHFKL